MVRIEIFLKSGSDGLTVQQNVTYKDTEDDYEEIVGRRVVDAIHEALWKATRTAIEEHTS